MEILPLLCILSVVCTGLTTGAGVLPDVPLNAAVGQTVTFTPTLTPPLVTVIWNFNQNKNIITFTGETFTAPEYEGRITFSPSSGSLELWSVNLNDTGEYSVFIIRQGELAKNGATTLRVYEPVSNVTLAANSTDLVEFNSSVTLTCSSSGPSLSFLWLNSSSEVTESDRVQLTDGGSTLTIVNVTRYDQGPFRCLVSNPVSNGSSIAVNLSISYGPENIILTSPPHEYYAVGSNFILSCSADSRPAAMFYWFLNGDQLTDTGAELRLTNIQMSQSGNYSCQGFNQKTGRYETSQSSPVTVLEPVSNVMLAASSTDLVEFNSSVTLTCSSSGSSLSFLWLNSSSEVTESDRVQLTDGGSTLTIVSVTRYDQGPFRCLVSNPVSNDSSNEVNLSISYGPENIILTSSPHEHYAVGSNITLSCSADSRPAAMFYWFLNGDQLTDTGAELRLTNIQMSQSGDYSCQAFNQKTLRYETSLLSVVSVLERISGVSLTSTTNLPIEKKSVNLTCEAAGTVFNRRWKKDGSDLILADNMMVYDENRGLFVHPLQRTDSGTYSCNVSNPFSAEEATFTMDVNYGPDNVQITGPSEVHVGQAINLTCSAESNPSASYTWMLNGTEIHNSAVFTKNTPEPSDSGEYTCQVTNKITERTSSAVHVLSVTGNSATTSGCSGGCIAGIVIAVLVILGAAGGGGYYVYRKKKQQKKPSNRNTATGPTRIEGHDNQTYSEELNYADIKFFKNKDGGTVQLGQQNNSEYAQIKVNNRPVVEHSPPTYDAHLQRPKREAPQPDVTQLYAKVNKNRANHT
uniref:carcinoembryonic antigen-related cell adhesion molecule 5-like isoform X1 n=1 Tax=Scatophagus argus TaxID=75038 RepID=UPI001ED7EF85|nr:carcinoembryonic antigen-related cell adhesion molecule 5-like isoform X1 [Scatophagus argus]